MKKVILFIFFILETLNMALAYEPPDGANYPNIIVENNTFIVEYSFLFPPGSPNIDKVGQYKKVYDKKGNLLSGHSKIENTSDCWIFPNNKTPIVWRDGYRFLAVKDEETFFALPKFPEIHEGNPYLLAITNSRKVIEEMDLENKDSFEEYINAKANLAWPECLDDKRIMVYMKDGDEYKQEIVWGKDNIGFVHDGIVIDDTIGLIIAEVRQEDDYYYCGDLSLASINKYTYELELYQPLAYVSEINCLPSKSNILEYKGMAIFVWIGTVEDNDQWGLYLSIWDPSNGSLDNEFLTDEINSRTHLSLARIDDDFLLTYCAYDYNLSYSVVRVIPFDFD